MFYLGIKGSVEISKGCMLEDEVGHMPQRENTVTGETGIRLSGGQQKRLALARTLAHPRPILILDDPFSA